ncbi:MAG: CpaD family pilus assembly protein [Alphaproteobacteria bacterium]|nr:CpaD family pilus assembly protein [Alphaproteobacteria bacterium]MBN9591222.1 CpaD family pilus assembly protein [Alphaproteobacteria bacterium]
MNTKHLLRLGALAAVLLAGSCANDPATTRFADGAANHPITVSPSYKTLSLPFVAGSGSLNGENEAKFEAFVQDFRSRGNGAISVSAPAGPGAADTIRYFGEKLASLGVARTSIMVGTHDIANGGSNVTVGYLAYTARAGNCRDWSEDAANTWTNEPMPDFGCSVQHNIAAMVADPRDLLGPRPMGPGDATRRATIMNKYEKGEPTAATKTSDQSGNVSQVQ